MPRRLVDKFVGVRARLSGLDAYSMKEFGPVPGVILRLESV